MVQCVSILGSTGSIGRQSLDIIRRLPGIRVAALTAGTNVERMAQQCREFSRSSPLWQPRKPLRRWRNE